eukprot:c29080_g4_i1 orf=435-1607(-)
MASQNNFFALLVDDENDDPASLFARAVSPKGSDKPLLAPRATKQLQQEQQTVKLPVKPLPPSQAVRGAQQAQSDTGRGRGNRGSRGGGRGNFGIRGRGQESGGFQGERRNSVDRNYSSTRENIDTQGPSKTHEEYPGENGEGGKVLNAPRMPARGRSRGRGFGFVGDGEERQRTRFYDRRSGTGRGNEIKRDGAGRGNWGTETDPDFFQEIVDVSLAEEEKLSPDSGDKKPEETIAAESANAEEKTVDEEDNVMTLDEYEKLLIEKRKPLEALKPEERKVLADKEFESMQLVDKRHDDDGVFLKLGIDGEKGKKKMLAEKEEKVKKAVSINEFLKPAEGEEYYSPAGRRGRGRGERGGFRGGLGGRSINGGQILALHIEDPGQFPTLCGK